MSDLVEHLRDKHLLLIVDNCEQIIEPFMAQQLPTEDRSSGLGAGREISGAIAGGLAPLAALAMVTLSPTNATWGVSLLLVACALLVVVGVVFDQNKRLVARSRTAASREILDNPVADRVSAE